MINIVTISTMVWESSKESGVIVELSGTYESGSVELTFSDDMLFRTAATFPEFSISPEDIANEVARTTEYLRATGMCRAVTTLGIDTTSIHRAGGEAAVDYTWMDCLNRRFGDAFPEVHKI